MMASFARIKALFRQLKTGEFKPRGNRTADEGPGTEGARLLPGIGRYNRLWSRSAGEIRTLCAYAHEPFLLIDNCNGAPADQCQTSAASTRCQRDTSPSRNRK